MKYGFIITFASLLLLGACRQSSAPKTEGQNSTTPSETPATRNVVRKRLNIPSDFSYITNIGSVDIIYTQGNFSLEAEGDSATLSYLKTDIESGLLTVNVLSDNNSFLNQYGNQSNIKLYVSSPQLNCISICSNGSFESQATLRSEHLQIGCMGKGNLKLGQVKCTTFELQSSETNHIAIEDLQADDATFYSRSAANIEAHVNVKNLVVLNEGKQTMKLTGNAQIVAIQNPDDPNLTNEVNSAPTK